MGNLFGVGREAPTFSLTSQDGDVITLKQYRGDWLPVLVFCSAKSVDVVKQLTALSAAAGQLWGLRGQLLGICGASGVELHELVDEAGGVGFPMMADEDGAVARRYGAWNKRTNDVQPLACIVDRSGKLVWQGEGAEALKPAALTAVFEAVVR